ncbi:hypothetical protein DFH07DRAFT_952636 [Mycena maculata]|uniref:ATP-dependent DNA helicase n=1 Tax=Mycena maculata TaxID=230809 RepID=A0AAD7JX03_9AGAR|nr:hypothetical protein DFH07DRAFT_952636 [Mycena maculata]
MVVRGVSGTGETTLLVVIHHMFKYLGAEALAAVTGATPMAAALIGGRMLHSWAVLPSILHAPVLRPSVSRGDNLCRVKYLFVDQYSALTKWSLASLLEAIAKEHGPTCHNTMSPFGGLNVILFGNLLDFPPTMGPRDTLFRAVDADEHSAMGCMLFDRLSTVVTLQEQHRVKVEGWTTLLESVDWDNVTLISHRISIVAAWNQTAVSALGSATECPMYRVHAMHLVRRGTTQLTAEELALMACAPTYLKGCLPALLDIVITHAGEQIYGIIIHITLDAHEPRAPLEELVLDLLYQPAVVMQPADPAYLQITCNNTNT